MERPLFKNKKEWVRLKGNLSIDPDNEEVMITVQDKSARDIMDLAPNNFYRQEVPKSLGWLDGESAALGGDLFRYMDSGQAILGDDSTLSIEDYENQFAAEGAAIKRN